MLNLQQLQFLMELLNNPNSTVSIGRAKICASTMEELESQLEAASTFKKDSLATPAAPATTGEQ